MGTTTNAGQFDGSHGDGALSTDDYATNATWPGYSSGKVTAALAAAFRAGGWLYGASFGRVSSRCAAGDAGLHRDSPPGAIGPQQ